MTTMTTTKVPRRTHRSGVVAMGQVREGGKRKRFLLTWCSTVRQITSSFAHGPVHSLGC